MHSRNLMISGVVEKELKAPEAQTRQHRRSSAKILISRHDMPSLTNDFNFFTTYPKWHP